MAPTLPPRIDCECGWDDPQAIEEGWQNAPFFERRALLFDVWDIPHYQDEWRCGRCHTLMERTAPAPRPTCALPPCALVDLPEQRRVPPPREPRRVFPVSEWSFVGHNITIGFAMRSNRPPTVEEKLEEALDRAVTCTAHNVQYCSVEACCDERRLDVDDYNDYKNQLLNRPRGRGGFIPVFQKAKTAVFAGVTCPRVGGGWWIYRRKPHEKVRAWRHRIHEIRRMVNLGQELKREKRWDALAAESPQEWLEKTSAYLYKLKYLDGRVSNCSLNIQNVYGQLLAFGPAPPKVHCPRKIKLCGPRTNKGYEYIEKRLALKKLYADLQDEWKEAKVLRREKMSRVLIRKDNHQVVALKAALIKAFEDFARKDPSVLNSFDDELANDPPKGEMADSDPDKEKDAHGIGLTPIPDQKSNVVFLDQESKSESSPLPVARVRNEFSCAAMPESKISTQVQADRWFTFHSGVWSNEVVGSTLFSKDLLKDVINMPKFRNSPNYAPFGIHAYWRGTMEVQFRMNSNVRQYGQLQLKFYYLAYADANFDIRNNIYCGSQMPHVLISAQDSNSGSLKIPFEYTCPVLTITKGEQTWDSPPADWNFANLGKLVCQVIVPLTSGDSIVRKVGYTVVIAFSDNEFGGMIDKSLVENTLTTGEMFSMASLWAIHEAANAFDNNRDNPTVSATGMPVIPVNSGSWCIGNGMPEWSNVLRLNPKSSTPYQEGRVPQIDEMQINHIKQVYGLFKQIQWKSQDMRGKLLFSFDAAPLLPKSQYPNITKDNVNLAIMPPVAVLTELFAWWRGSLNLRIDVVGATELSGRLLVCYVPKRYSDITLDQAENCANTTIDLQKDNRQANFLIPYVADKLFWERQKILKDEFTSVPPPGRVYIFVSTQLVVNATIPDNCYLNLYIAGGKDFELSVPAFPSIGTGFFRDILIEQQSQHEVFPKLGYHPIYTDTWRYTGALPAFRYGATTDHIAQFEFTGAQAKVLGKLLKFVTPVTKTEWEITFTCANAREQTNTYKVKVPIRTWVAFRNGNYVYGFPLLPDLLDVTKDWDKTSAYFQQEFKVTQYPYGPKKDKSVIINKRGEVINEMLQNMYHAWDSMHNENFSAYGNSQPGQFYLYQLGTSTPVVSADYIQPSSFVCIPRPDQVFAQAGEERTLAKTKPSNPQPTACGRPISGSLVFGERFFDLKDYCRRYQLYAQGEKVLSLVSDLHYIIIKFPALPQGLDLIVKDHDTNRIKHYWNRSRDGPIPIIASGYRFFTGGLRFRIIVDVVGATSAWDRGKIFVQHRPDFWNQSLQVDTRSDVLIGSDDIELPGYATYYQFDEINNVICIEIPFYLPVVRSLLQRPNDAAQAVRWSSLGEVAVGISLSSAQANKFRYEIYYSLADDARFSVFQGFPPMLDASNIPPFPITPIRQPMACQERPLVVEEGSDFSELDMPHGEMGIFDWSPFSKTSSAIENVSKIDVDKINDTVEETHSFISTMKDQIKSFVPTIEGVKNKIDKYMSLIINVITNFIHCLLNLNIKSVCTAIVSIFTQIKLVSYNMTAGLIDGLFKLFKQQHPGASDELKEETKRLIETPEGQMLDDAPVDLKQLEQEDKTCKAAYISTLIAGVAAALVITPRVCRSNWNSISLILFDGLKQFAMTANHLFTFIKNNLMCIQKIGNWLVDSTPAIKDIKFLESQSKEIYDWAVEVIELTDPWKENELFTSMKKASRVHELCTTGSLMLLKLSKIKLENQQFGTITRLLDQITKLRDRLARSHMAPPVKFEPFVYELTGPTGTGKSTILNELPYILLKHMNIKHAGEVIYHRALGNAYWNNCRNQPVCSIDEKFPVSKPGFDDVQMAELFQLKSRCVFNPPMADIPDKNLRYNPLIVQYASNNPFPALTGLLDSKALYRRRDVLVEVRFKDAIIKQYGDTVTLDKLNYEDRRDFRCLNFYFYQSVLEETNNCRIGPYEYPAFCREMCLRFQNYYIKEEALFRRHLQKALSLYPEEGDTINSFEDKWHQEIGVFSDDEPIRKFKDGYRELLKSVELPQNEEDTKFKYRVINLIRRSFGMMELSPDEFKDAHTKLKQETFKINTVKIKAIDEPKGQMNDSLMLLRDTLKSMETICPHHMVTHFDLMETSNIDYIKEYNLWEIDFSYLDETFSLINTGVVKELMINVASYSKQELKEVNELQDPKDLSEIFKVKDKIYINNKGCNISNCPFKDEMARISYFKQYVHNRVSLNGPLKNGNITLIRDKVSDEYLKYLSDQISGTESAARREEKLKEVSFIRKWYDIVKEKLMSIDWRKWFQRLAIVLAVVFFVGALWSLWTFVDTGSVPEKVGAYATSMGLSCSLSNALGDKRPEAQGFASGDYKQGTVKSKTPRGIAARQLESIPHGEMNAQQYMALRGSIQRNTFFLSAVHNDSQFSIGRCLGVCGKYALIADHFYEAWNNFRLRYADESMHFIPASGKTPTFIPIKFSELKYIKFQNSSLGLLKMPVRIPAFKDIRKWIAPKAFHANSNGLGTIFEADSNNKSEIIMREHKVEYTLQPSMHVCGSDLFSDFETGTCYKYQGYKGAGNCGSLLINDYMNTPIVGMHVAGNSTYGFSESIYFEMFSHLSAEKDPSAQGELGLNQSTRYYVDAHVVGIGAVAAKFAHRANEKSRIIPSIIQNSKDPRFPVHTERSMLSPKDSRQPDPPFSPMLEGCKHHGKPLDNFSPLDFRTAKQDLENLILAKCKPTRLNPRLLSINQAIGGIPEKPGYEHIEWNSSEGFPFTAYRPAGAKNKRWLFNFNEEGQYESIQDSRLMEVLHDKWEMRCQNIIPDTVFTDCLKDCTVDKEKARLPGKTRIFSISPVDFTIQQRQCTLDFVAAYMANRLELEHAVGINPDSFEWTELAQKLLENGDSIATGDYSKFGDTIPAEFIHAFFDIVIKWYLKYGELSSEHKQQLRIMAHEISNSIHLMFDFLYKVVCGQPSGNSLTVIINSFSNSLYIRMAWLACMRRTKFNSLEDLHKHVKFFSYGDDIIISLADNIKESFNASHLHEFFSHVGLKFTNADKSDQIVPFTNLSQADFLKRSFLVHPCRSIPQVLLAPLNIKSIEDTVNWVNKDSFGRDNPQCQNYLDMCVQVCEDALRNAFGRGPKYYESFALKLSEFWCERGVHFKFATWEQLDVKVFILNEPLNQYFKYKYIPKSQS